MAKNEDGEFELILGNRQLLSVFFIVVILLGLFFTMGYILGRRPDSEVASAAKPEPKPLVVTSPASDSAAPAAAQPAEAPTQTAPEKPVTEVVQPEPKPSPRKAEPAKTKPVESPKPAPAAAPSDLPTVGQTYLQLAATTEREAKLEVDVLRKKGFKAMAAEIPEKRGTFRVLVGPVGESGTNKLKADLSAAGFPGDKAIRRTF